MKEKEKEEKNMKEKDLYFAQIGCFNEKGVSMGLGGWGFYVSPEKCNAFTIKFANELLDWGKIEYKKRFGKDVDFNFIRVEMGETTGEYNRIKNRLLIEKDGMPVYLNNNGTICRDSTAILDG